MPLEISEVAAGSLAFIVAMSWHDALGHSIRKGADLHPIAHAAVVTLIVIILVGVIERFEVFPTSAARLHAPRKKMVSFENPLAA